MSEKSTWPKSGELTFMPFHVTCVCEGAVPRNEAVAIVPRPYDLMNTGVLCVSASASDEEMLSRRTMLSSFVRWTHISFIGRVPVISTRSMSRT